MTKEKNMTENKELKEEELSDVNGGINTRPALLSETKFVILSDSIISIDNQKEGEK